MEKRDTILSKQDRIKGDIAKVLRYRPKVQSQGIEPR